MSGHALDTSGSDTRLAISQLPATALQALYHAVTGRTENLSKRLNRNIIVKRDDLDRLISMLRQQMQHYVLTAGPTITAKIRFANQQSQQFSSWERFSIQDTWMLEVTSEVVIKLEFLLQLPETTAPQRCVININLDSKLPMYDEAEDYVSFWFMHEFPTATISIDFVDYLIAKIFSDRVEDWLKGIPELQSRPWVKKFARPYWDWTFIFDKFALFGLAAFASTYVVLRGGSIKSIGGLVYLSALGLVLFAISSLLTRFLGLKFTKSIHMSNIYSMIVLTRGDEEKSQKVLNDYKKSFRRMSAYTGSAVSSIALNILASYVYAVLTK